MKHYRILEIKTNQKYYTIQYLKNAFLGFHVWKNLNNKSYNKYDEALTDVKKYITKEDYETPSLVYHYIDAYKIFKTVPHIKEGLEKSKRPNIIKV